MTQNLDLTVVVASRNRRDELLHSLGRHEAPVVLVDNASTDGTADAVAAAHPRVRVVRLERNVGAAARTLGARLADTELVAFADDDSWWAPGALAAGAALMRRHPRVALLNGRILVGADERVDAVSVEMAASPLPAGPRPLGPQAGAARPEVPGPRLLGFVACAAIVRREPFLAVGGFDDVIRFPGEEDRVAMDLAAAGWHLVYSDELVVHHHPSPRRDDAERRRAMITRSRLLTAVMRRPWRTVLGEAVAAVTAGPAGRRGAASAASDLPAAVRARRRVPWQVESELRILEQARQA